jgi:tetratricopeptide (TPR) repeat protein
MLYWFWVIILWIWDNGSLERNALRNSAKREAERAYRMQYFAQASQQYQLIIDNSVVRPVEVQFDLAQALFAQKKYKQAEVLYRRNLQAQDPAIVSNALNQLGLLLVLQGDTVEAIQRFKSALRTQPDNDIARYNFELLKKNYTPRKASPPSAQAPKESPKTENQTPEQAMPDLDDQKEETLKRLKNYNLSEEKAQQILEELRNAERQYLQQIRRGGNAKNKSERSDTWW